MNRKFRGGFTLVEILLVIGILAVLATVFVVGYTRVRAGSDRQLAQTLVNNTAQAVRQYQVSMGSFPDSETGLQALIQVPSDDERLAQRWRDGGGPYLDPPKIPVDPWGHELKYEVSADPTDISAPPFRVWSVGPDGNDGSDDDLRSWTETAQ